MWRVELLTYVRYRNNIDNMVTQPNTVLSIFSPLVHVYFFQLLSGQES